MSKRSDSVFGLSLYPTHCVNTPCPWAAMTRVRVFASFAFVALDSAAPIGGILACVLMGIIFRSVWF